MVSRDRRAKIKPKGTLSSVSCPVCEQTFPRRNDWKRHVKPHYVEKIWTCPLCPKTTTKIGKSKERFNRPDLLRSHLRRSTEHYEMTKEAIEEIISSQTPTKTELKPSECPRCNRRFDSLELLIGHFIRNPLQRIQPRRTVKQRNPKTLGGPSITGTRTEELRIIYEYGLVPLRRKGLETIAVSKGAAKLKGLLII
ncbi:hypothetical protein TSTA_109300 [Talaromyces stipitatus ATCC 10500]|uniref:C2H2-type domain-containing protein n=1 Tax=Talaromyces stipitatus (strain ATCC 10500 / CBS 375.48 / QM 6759 / NRRL 1006) TaxID=441959 RepID=B8MV35_TALSN|nr:uncharacterized protein TSTA_109300 [Talaromyces stipitatus ATCC 10500]EED11751.1 hypothetical protein TSTA_109300 [Talaromyces stipitatus ATCC 10500]